MRHSLRLLSTLFAIAVTALAALLPVVGSAAALADDHPLISLQDFENLMDEVLTHRQRIQRYQPYDSYCVEDEFFPNKKNDRALLDKLEAINGQLKRKFQYLTSLANKNFGKPSGPLAAAAYPKVNGMGPLDAWANPNDYWKGTTWAQRIQNLSTLLAAKRAEMEAKPVDTCRKPPPPKPQPVDWMRGLKRPTPELISFIAPPPRFCSADEKNAWIAANITPELQQAADNAQDAANYVVDVGRVKLQLEGLELNGTIDDDGKKGLKDIRAEYKWAEENRAKQYAADAAIKAHAAKARAIPIVDCSGPSQPVPDGAPIPQPDYEPANPMETPERFCSEAEKEKFLEEVQKNHAAARRNYEKADALAKELQKRIAAGDRTAGLPVAQREAGEAATRYFSLWIGLDRVYYQALAMPVVDCTKKEVSDARTTGTAPAEPGTAEPRTSEPPGTLDPALRYAGEFGGFRIAAGVGYENRPTQVYLGFENAAAEQTFAVEGLDDDGSFTALNGEVSFAVDPIVRYTSPRIAGFVAFGFDRFDVDGSTFRAEIDPFGRKLLLPFVATPGIALGTNVPEGTPGGANVVNDFSYRYDADQFTLYGKYGQRWDCGDGAFTGYAGVGYTNRDQRQFVSGSIPGFRSDFRYGTDIEVETWRLFAGLRYERPLFDTGLNVFAGAMGSLNFVDGRGRDRVNVSGFLTFDEQIELKKSDTTFGYAVDVGIAKHIDEAAMALYIAYRHVGDDTTPVVVREDDGPSHLTFQPSDYDMIVLGATIRF